MLKHLLLNCLLAPLVVVGVALILLIAQHQRAYDRWREAERDQAMTAAARLAGMIDPTMAPELLLHAAQLDPRWQALAVVQADETGDHLRLIAGVGVLALDLTQPPPAVIAAVHQTMAWREGSHAWTAAPVQVEGVVRALLIGRWQPLPAAPWADLALAAAILVALGSLLAWYLAQRIYRPVAWLTRAAEAAVAGQPEPSAVESDETEACRSAVLDLARRYRSGAVPVAGMAAAAGTVAASGEDASCARD